jgi:cytochrome c biogenesis protein CcdA
MADTADRIEKASQKVHKLADKSGAALVDGFHLLALFAIGATIVWAAVFEFSKMMATLTMPIRRRVRAVSAT